MTDPSSELSIFTRLSNEKITALSEFFDESIISRSPDEKKIKEIIGKEFSEDEIGIIKTAFFNFFASKPYSQQILAIIDDTNLDDTKKEFLKEVVKNIHAGLDEEKIKDELKHDLIRDFGHPHLHGIGIFPEFRPILKDGKITKMIPSLVISGTLQNTYENDDETSLNFQTDLEGAESLVKNFTVVIEETKTQISEIRKKFGEDIID